MPLRNAVATTRCHRCDTTATSTCARCNRPSCDEHDVGRGRRCGPCESELDRRLAEVGPVELKKGARELGQIVGVVAGLGAIGVGGLGLLFCLLTGQFAALVPVVLVAALVGGLTGAIGVSFLALPFVGKAGTIAGTRALRRRRERRRFFSERPGQRQLPAARGDTEEE